MTSRSLFLPLVLLSLLVPSAAFAQVDLLSAQKTSGCRYGTCWERVVVDALVENLAYHKKVRVRYQAEADNQWYEADADYVRTTGTGREVWQAALDESATYFELIYEVGGRTYRDNNAGRYHDLTNRGRDVSPEGVLLGDAFNVLVWSPGNLSRTAESVSVSINVRNIAYGKRVSVVYTTDGWRTLRVASAKFAGASVAYGYGSWQNPSVFGTETWNAFFDVGEAARVEYAVMYESGGRVFWDNNFGQNYVVVRD